MEITVKKLTDLDLLRRANEFTTGHESKMSLERAYFYGHSPIRTQIFWVEMKDIPLFVASQLVRQHVGVQFFQRSKRVDRGGEDFAYVCNEIASDVAKYWGNQGPDMMLSLQHQIYQLPNIFDRYAPTDLACIINAEALINMAHKRLCFKASAETRQVVQMIRNQISAVDPALARLMQPPCVAHGGICYEPNSCGFNTSDTCSKIIVSIKSLKLN
jgi:hypothetical protein